MNGAGRNHSVANHGEHDAHHDQDDEGLLIRLIVLGEEPVECIEPAQETEDGVQNARLFERVNKDLDRRKKRGKTTNDK
ncbi:MAG: hypothetical protein ACK5R3_04955 [Armatimonadota bacterium]